MQNLGSHQQQQKFFTDIINVDFTTQKANFKIEVVYSCECPELANLMEIQLIEQHDCIHPKGYNMSPGGDIVLANRIKPTMLGKSHSEETKAKMSKAAAGKPKSKEHVEKMRLSKKGKCSNKLLKHMRDMAKARIGKSINGKPLICIETGQEFESAEQAAKHFNTYVTKIHRQVNNLVKKTKFPFTFKRKVG